MSEKINTVVSGIVANLIFAIIVVIAKRFIVTGMTSKMLYIIIGIGVIAISLITIIVFLFFQNIKLQRTTILPKGMTSKMLYIIIGIGVVVISFIPIVSLFFQNKELQELQRTAILPKGYEFTDVQGYVIDESKTTIELSYDENHNLYKKYTLYFKIIGGVEDTYKIFHNFGTSAEDSAMFSGFTVTNISTNRKLELDHKANNNGFDLQVNFVREKLKKGDTIEYEINIIMSFARKS